MTATTVNEMMAHEAAHDHHPDPTESKELGFWFYLMSDGVIFALLFVTYGVMSHSYAGGPTGKDLFELGHTFWETLALLLSSITCGFAMLSAYKEKRGATIGWLLVTLVFGLSFVGMEISEFRDMIMSGAGPDRSGFLSSFFTLVGTHGLHVSMGMIWLLVMVGQIATKGFNPMVMSRMARWSLFWHFLDIIWIGIFSIVYLPGII